MKKKKFTLIEKNQRKQQRLIKSTFELMGFEHLNTRLKEKTWSNAKGDVDSVYLYENILLISEDSVDQDPHKHVKTKAPYLKAIQDNKADFIKWLKDNYKEKFGKFNTYTTERYKLKNLYINENPVAEDFKERYKEEDKPKIYFLDKQDILYFNKVAKAIKLSAKYELYRYLDLKLKDISISTSETLNQDINTAVIIPEMSSGFDKSVRIVSFLTSAENILKCAYVLRKDNWEKKIELYQRLIEPTRISQIRNFLATEKKTFINNIIVSLPPSAKFSEKNADVNPFTLDSIQNLNIHLPIEFNSIRIIDGQHRLYAYHEASSADNLESVIADLRKKLCLLVTGIVFEEKMTYAERVRLESKLFLEINDNQKKVSSINLLNITSLQYPNSPTGISMGVLTILNKKETFLNYFELNSISKGKIKVPSVVKWGLNDIVEINKDKDTLFKYWNKDGKEKLFKNDNDQEVQDLLKEYIEFCANEIGKYFSGVKGAFKQDWEDQNKNNRFFSVTSITGFIIAYKLSLSKYGLKDARFYSEKLKNLKISFKKVEFKYKSSHWNDFANQIESECWN